MISSTSESITSHRRTQNPILYAFKGLAGLFPGTFRFHSYETKIREYGNLEARDLLGNTTSRSRDVK